MPNCDWGRPCDCKDCRTATFGVTCPSCGFDTTVSYIMESDAGSIDRKGMFSYTFKEKTDRGYTLRCFKCSYEINDVPYYEKVEKTINERKVSERICAECDKKEFASFRPVEYREWNGKTLCLDCAIEKRTGELNDPSTKDKKYKINPQTMEYELLKVLVPCKDCGKKRWLDANEQWKVQCLPCYKKERIGSFR